LFSFILRTGAAKQHWQPSCDHLAAAIHCPSASGIDWLRHHPPHVVLECIGGPPDAVFQNNGWNRRVPNIVVFDDNFIDGNVYSGLAVEPEHRRHLHELILGVQGITLNTNLQQLIQQVEARTRELRVRTDAVPLLERGTLSVDDFCLHSERRISMQQFRPLNAPWRPPLNKTRSAMPRYLTR
jgi:hypothetical protein